MIDQTFIDRLNQHPKLCERLESLLNIVENTNGDCTKADDAEQFVIDELRKMGNDTLHCWGDKAAKKATEALREREPDLHGNGKKKPVGTQHLEKFGLLNNYCAVQNNFSDPL